MKTNTLVACLAIGGAVLAGPALAQSGKKSAAGATTLAPACGPLNFENGQMTCSCNGSESGSVWGSGPYTSDSNVCTAARHAGAVGSGGGNVTVYDLPGEDKYESTSANGVTTSSWGGYGSSFGFQPASTETATSDLPACSTMPAGVDNYSCYCGDGNSGSVWGNGPYTADSNICAAARHSNYLDGEGDVHVLRTIGLAEYYGSENNGVTTSSWGGYDESITFDWNR